MRTLPGAFGLPAAFLLWPDHALGTCSIFPSFFFLSFFFLFSSRNVAVSYTSTHRTTSPPLLKKYCTGSTKMRREHHHHNDKHLTGQPHIPPVPRYRPIAVSNTGMNARIIRGCGNGRYEVAWRMGGENVWTDSIGWAGLVEATIKPTLYLLAC